MSATNLTASTRADAIRRAAIPVFAAQGFRRTSMADIARAAGVSRAALYQYYENRADLFRASFETLLEDATDAALAALDGDGSVDHRLDEFLQRAVGDGYASLAATPFGVELMEAKHEFAADVAAASAARGRSGLQVFVDANSTADVATRRAALELLLLAPAGLKSDAPSPADFRRRLTALAAAASRLLAVS